MAKQGSYQSSQRSSAGKGNQASMREGSTPTEFVDRDLMKVNPNDQQFEPTDADPVRQKYRMAGGCK